MPLLLICRLFKKGIKNVKTFLKSEQIQLLQRKVYRNKTVIGRKLITSNSNKMQALVNTSKVQQTIPAGSLKKLKPSKKHPKNKLSLVREVLESKTSSLVKPRS